jgi:hypothetical protein
MPSALLGPTRARAERDVVRRASRCPSPIWTLHWRDSGHSHSPWCAAYKQHAGSIPPWNRSGWSPCASVVSVAWQRSAAPRRSWVTSSTAVTGSGWWTVGSGVPAAPVNHATAIQIPTRSTLPGVVPEAWSSAAGSAGIPHGWRSGGCMRWPTRLPSARAAATSTCRFSLGETPPSEWPSRARLNETPAREWRSRAR